MRKIVHLVTGDFRLFFKVQQVIPPQFQLIHTLTYEPLQSRMLIITDRSVTVSDRSTDILQLNPKLTLVEIKRDLLRALSQSSIQTRWIIGIDPGFSIGLALLYQDQIFNTTVVYTVDAVVSWIKGLFRSVIKQDEVIIRIGNGGREVLDKLIIRLKREFHQIKMELVDEMNTSVRSSAQLTIHENAAILIARRKGIKLSKNERV